MFSCLQNTRLGEQRFQEVQSGDKREAALLDRLCDAVPRLQRCGSRRRIETIKQIQTSNASSNQVGGRHNEGHRGQRCA